MVRCVLSQLKPSGLPLSAVKKASAFGLRPFSQLRMESSSAFILYIIYYFFVLEIHYFSYLEHKFIKIMNMFTVFRDLFILAFLVIFLEIPI